MTRVIEGLISLMRTMAVLMLGIRAGQGQQFALGIEAFAPVAEIVPITVIIIVIFFPIYTLWDCIEDYLDRREQACSVK